MTKRARQHKGIRQHGLVSAAKATVSGLLAAILLLGGLTIAITAVRVLPVSASATAPEVFFDDFSGDSLNGDNWLVAEKSWGGFNGGVVPENVSVSGGTLKLEGHGNLYQGNVAGVNRQLSGGIRTGAAVATRQYYASGCYEVRARVAPVLGACSAIWTFQYEEHYPGDPVYEASGATGSYMTVNHEIDIELPTANGTHPTPSFSCARFNTYTAENRVNSNFHDLPYAVDDGEFHNYRFDWHTGNEEETARVDFYVDDIYICTSTKHVPTNAGRLWLGLWFPCAIDSDHDGYGDTGWTGTADFDTAVFEIDYVRITPFHESGDTIRPESYPKDGWAADSFPEDIEAEHYEHIINGDFSGGADGWTLSGDAFIADNRVKLSTGSVTDTVSQIVQVHPKMTYTLESDVYSDGTPIIIGVEKLNGIRLAEQAYTQDGHAKVTFVTGAADTQVKIFARVERYGTGNPALADNFSLQSGMGSTGETQPVPEQPSEPDTTPEQAPPAVNLLLNGDFSQGAESWRISGSAVIPCGEAHLASGSDTDGIAQSVRVNKGGSYTLFAEIISEGTQVNVGVRDYAGRYTQLADSTDTSCLLQVSFTCADHIDNIEIFAQVLRYQSTTDVVRIRRIVLIPDDGDAGLPPTPEPELPESGTEPVSVADNLLLNGALDGSGSDWKLSGSASISAGQAVLTSGSDTDTISQMVALKPHTTYHLCADLITEGCAVELKVTGYDGKYSKREQSYTESARGEIIFTTGSFAGEVRIVVQVLRYQSTPGVVYADNLILTEQFES